MQRFETTPHPILADRIKCLWTEGGDFQPPHDTHLILPDSYVELICWFGDECRVETGDLIYPLPRCCLVGLHDHSFSIRGRGPITVIGARFYAWGLTSLVALNMIDLPNKIHALDAEWLALTAQMSHYVAQAGVSEAMTLFQTFLIKQVLQNQVTPGELEAAALWLQSQGGQATVSELAERSHLSRRQLERRFSRLTGVSPKNLARKMRFEQVRDQLWQNPDIDLASLAYDCGYADQAHLIREFKQFSGRTPGQMVAEVMATRQLLPIQGVAIIQD